MADGGAPVWALNMQANIEAGQANLLAGQANTLAEIRVLLNNSHAYNGEQRIEPVIMPGLPLPFQFPNTRNVFMHMTANQRNQLINYYCLPAMAGAAAEVKCRAIGARIGLRF